MRFSLQSLMLIVTLCAVAAAITAQLPGLGALFCAVAVVALTRSMQGVYRRRAEGSACGAIEKVAMFCQSFAIVSMLFFAAGAAFAVTCFLVFWALIGAKGDGGIIVAVFVGVVAAGFVLYKVGRAVWPWRD